MYSCTHMQLYNTLTIIKSRDHMFGGGSSAPWQDGTGCMRASETGFRDTDCSRAWRRLQQGGYMRSFLVFASAPPAVLQAEVESDTRRRESAAASASQAATAAEGRAAQAEAAMKVALLRCGLRRAVEPASGGKCDLRLVTGCGPRT